MYTCMHTYAHIHYSYTYLFQCGQGRYPHHCCKSHPLPNSSTSSYDLCTTRTLHDTYNTTYIRIRCLILSHIFITRAPNFRHFITLDFTYSLILCFISTVHIHYTVLKYQVSKRLVRDFHIRM